MAAETTLDAGFAGRIQRLLVKRGLSTNAFHQALEAAGVEGSGYSTVFRYVKGQYPPPLPFVEAASELLEVRPAWLAFGEGPSPVEDTGQDEERAAAVTADNPFRELHAPREALMVHLLGKLIQAQPEGSREVSDDDVATVARALRVHLDVTLFAFTRGGDASPGSAGAQYPVLVLTAMLAAVPGPGEGRPLHEVLAKLPQRGPRDHLELPPAQEDVDDE